jgi:hypothetical protein
VTGEMTVTDEMAPESPAGTGQIARNLSPLNGLRAERQTRDFPNKNQAQGLLLSRDEAYSVGECTVGQAVSGLATT